VAGNLIGTNASGGGPVGNTRNGVFISGNNNTVGAAAATVSNVISGNGAGVEISGGSGNLLANNYIGTDKAGGAAVANLVYGVKLDNGAANNTIGGTQANMRNVISGNGGQSTGNSGFGIWLADSGTTGNVILGDYIGTDKNGLNQVGNQNDGVFIEFGANGNTVGGAAAGAKNLIAGNGQGKVASQTGYGIHLGSTNNLVQGNNIGLLLDNTTVMANTGGWMNPGGSSGNTVTGNNHN
jgi:titin